METTASLAIIAASAAVCTVAILMIVALGYVIYILRRVADSARQLKKTARDIGKDVRGAVESVIGSD